MIRKISPIVLLLALLLCTTSIAQAQERLPAPENLRHVSGATLAWDAVSEATGYRLRWERHNVGPRNFTSVSASQTSHNLPNLIELKLYRVQVRALGDGIKNHKKGKWSEPLLFEPERSSPRDLPAPGNLRQVSESSVAWDEVSGATGYRLRWNSDAGKGKRKWATVRGEETTSYTLPDLESYSTRVQVRALGDGEHYEPKGKWSSPTFVYSDK